MKDFQNKVAVITGGASGLGLEIARLAAGKGMKLVLSDIEERALKKAELEFADQGVDVLAVRSNVAIAKDVEQLAEKTIERFGAVHLLFNNAGVALSKTTWETTVSDWEWVLGVDLWGVIHGVRVFTPIMLKQNSPCHIVNTSSVAGMLSTEGMVAYNVAKHGVVTLSETLYHDLKRRGANIDVSVLCPAWVNTAIWDSARNRPEDLQNSVEQKAADDIKLEQSARHAIQSGKVTAPMVAEIVFAAIEENKFYILTHPKIKKWIGLRVEDILQDRQPTPQT
ncbi:MAG: SDR family NAD(P)-dependent oxidoreductase [Pseudomonadota bacterium]|nr:SDR family NAD(P)-dependent oxidoreductase [Pseudomonadota bacterium]